MLRGHCTGGMVLQPIADETDDVQDYRVEDHQRDNQEGDKRPTRLVKLDAVDRLQDEDTVDQQQSDQQRTLPESQSQQEQTGWNAGDQQNLADVPRAFNPLTLGA